MENMGKKQKSTWQDSYIMNKSFIDEKEHCIHLPVNMPKIKGVNDISYDTDYMFLDIKKMYPKLNFSGKWSTKSSEDGVNEYLFFYE